jgi:hypothetical protein
MELGEAAMTWALLGDEASEAEGAAPGFAVGAQ